MATGRAGHRHQVQQPSCSSWVPTASQTATLSTFAVTRPGAHHPPAPLPSDRQAWLVMYTPSQSPLHLQPMHHALTGCTHSSCQPISKNHCQVSLVSQAGKHPVSLADCSRCLIWLTASLKDFLPSAPPSLGCCTIVASWPCVSHALHGRPLSKFTAT